MALWAVATEVVISGPPMGIVADEHGGDYVHGGGVEGREIGLDAARVQRVAEALGRTPTTAEEWMSLACYNLGYMSVGRWQEAESIYDAKEAVRGEVEAGHDAWIAGEAEREAQRAAERERAAGQSARAARLARIAEAAYDLQMDDDGGLSAEDELTFQIRAAGEVDPQRRHQWMPPTLKELECVFCGQLEDVEVHQRWWERGEV